MNLYTDNDPYCCEWLENLVREGLLPDGDVLCSDIQDLEPEILRDYIQVHFFCGIGGWPLALRYAQWSEERPVWTGSCPCQPFSVAGKRKGFQDDRDLWPVWFGLIAKCHPATVLGEQVAAATEWLARVRGDLDAMGYAVGAMPIQAACAGAPQFRDRFWFVARSNLQQQKDRGLQRSGKFGGASETEGIDVGGMAFQSQLPQRESKHPLGTVARERAREDGSGIGAGHSSGQLAPGLCAGLERGQSKQTDDRKEFQTGERDGLRLLARNPREQVGTAGQSWERSYVVSAEDLGWGEGWTEAEFRSRGFTAAVASSPDRRIQFIECPDGKWRRLPPPRVRWLGNGIPARVAKLRALGNAIVPQAAAEFVRAYMEAEADIKAGAE